MMNAAIIGLGWWGKETVNAIQGKSERFTITRGVTLEPDEVKDFAKQHGLSLSTSYEDVLKDDDIDMVFLMTPHALHHDQIVAAARAGKHMFVDKPLVLTRAEAQSAVKACKDAGVQLGVGDNRRLWKPLQEMKRMIQSGELGHIMLAEGNMSHDIVPTLPAWRHDPKHSPFGGITPMGIHVLDAFTMFFGKAETAYGVWKDTAGTTSEADTACGMLTYKNGVVGYVGTCILTAFEWHVQVYGSMGWAMSDSDQRLTVKMRGHDPVVMEFPAVENPTADSILKQYLSFADAVEGKANYHISPEEMVNSIAAYEAVVKSMRSGKIETVE